MINLDNKVLRNLEEQVQYLTDQINTLKLMNNGFKIVGVIDSADNLPDPYTGSVGDCYLVKNEDNDNDLYIYDGSNFTLVGKYPLQGPQGNTGSQGPKGNTGDSTKWYTGLVFPSNPKAGDMFLNTSTYQVYRYSEGLQWQSQCNIKGIAGTDGLNGNSITNISTSHSDAQRKTTVTITTSYNGTITFDIPDGEPGVGFHIAHIYPDDVEGVTQQDTLDDYLTGTDYDSMEELLDSVWSASSENPADAVLVKTNNQGDFIFVIIVRNDEQVWDNAGQIESVQGPAGQDGTIIQSGQQTEVVSVGTANEIQINALPYQTSAPTAAYTPIGNLLKIVVLTSEPGTYYSGYYYIITEE